MFSSFPITASVLITFLFNFPELSRQPLLHISYHPFRDETSIFAPFYCDKEDEKKLFPPLLNLPFLQMARKVDQVY